MEQPSTPLCLALVAALCCATAGAGEAWYVGERYNGTVYRLVDLNGDGDALDAGERALWADGMEQTLGLTTDGRAIYAVDRDADRILRCADLNGDGDALDTGESLVWADGLDYAYGATYAAGAVYVTEWQQGEVWRLADLNGDGDALDAGERSLYARDLFSPISVLARRQDAIVASYNGNCLYRLADLNGDGDALDVGENLAYTPPVINQAEGFLPDGAGGLFVGARGEDTIYRVRDLNGDGDAFDVVEVLSYADGVFGEIDGPWGMAGCRGGFLAAQHNSGQVSLVRDLNGDGDALDVGEAVLFAAGLASPAEIVALAEAGTVGYNDVTVTDGSAAWHVTQTDPFESYDAAAELGSERVEAEMAGGASVSITTGSGGAGNERGDVTINAVIRLDLKDSPSLTINAAGNITVNQPVYDAITSESPNVTLNADAEGDGTGDVLIHADVNVKHGTLSSRGVDLLIGADADVLSRGSVVLDHTGRVTIGGLMRGADYAVDANEMTVASGGRVAVDGGTADVYCPLTIASVGTLGGVGTLNLHAGLDNNGVLRAESSGLFTVAATGPAPDFDGSSEAGYLGAAYGDLVIDAAAADEFDGNATVANSHTLTFNQAWTLGAAGRLGLYGAAGLVTLAGADATVKGTIVAEDAARISADVGFRDTCSVQVLAAEDRLELMGDATFRGGSYTGDGTLVLDGDVQVTADTDIRTATLNWDGYGVGRQTTIALGTVFSIHSQQIDDLPPATDGFDGTVHVDGGTLGVYTPGDWRMDGTMNLAETRDVPAVVAGSRMLVYGAVNVTGEATIEADVEFAPGSSVALPGATDRLSLDGQTTYDGGAVGDKGHLGTLVQNGEADVTGDTTVRAGVYDWDGAGEGTRTTIEGGCEFEIAADRLDVDPPAADGFDGRALVRKGASLTVRTASPWRIDGEVHLDGGALRGTGVEVQGALNGWGEVLADGLDNNGELSAMDGTLAIGTAKFPDLDGSGDRGTVNAVDGSVHVQTGIKGLFDFHGRLNVAGRNEFRMDSGGLRNSGEMSFAGGGYVAPALEQAGKMTFTGDAAWLDAGAVFQPGSATTVDARVTLLGSAVVHHGADVGGSGELTVARGASLGGDGTIEVDVHSEGEVAPGLSVGRLRLGADYQQAATGVLAIELDGTAPGEWDELGVAKRAELAGTLALVLGPAFKPDYGDAFDVLTAGAVSGQFERVTGGDIDPEMYLTVIYGDDRATVVAGMPGDTDVDRDVDFLDYFTIKANYGTGTGADWHDGDFDRDRDVDFADYHAGRERFGWHMSGQAVPLVGGRATPEPTTLLLLACGGLALTTRRRP